LESGDDADFRRVEYICDVTSLVVSVLQQRQAAYRNLGFEVLTAEVTKSSISWDIRPYSLVKANRRYGGTDRLRLQGRRIKEARNQRESRIGLFFHPEE
jgi:hypothetical protein